MLVWKYGKSKGQEQEERLPSGYYNVVIEQATFEEQTEKFRLQFRVLDANHMGRKIFASYFMVKKDGTENPVSIGVLYKLSQIIVGADIEGVVHPDNLVGGLAKLHLTYTEDEKYQNVYKYYDPDAEVLDAYYDGKCGAIVETYQELLEKSVEP